MNDTLRLAELVRMVACHLETVGYRGSPVVFRAAQRLAELGRLQPVTITAGCPQCGRTVEQTGRGRPRRYCSAACRRRANR